MADSVGTSNRIDPLKDDIDLSDYVRNLPLEARTRYVTKLLFNYGQNILPDPYNVKKNWSNDPMLWPNVEFGNIYCYLIETPGSFTHQSLQAFKSLEAYRFVVSGHVQVVEYNGIGEDIPYCAVRAKVTPSQRINEKPHQPWAYLDKKSAAVFCAHCTCLAGLGEVCSHVAALLFKMEIGVRLGLTNNSPTSELCKWNQAFRKQLEPMTVSEIQPMLKGGNRSKLVRSVIPSGRDELPDISVLETLKKACPHAVFFSTIPPLDPEETETASETGIHQQVIQPLRDLYREGNIKNSSDVDGMKQVWSGYKCSAEQAKNLEMETRGQSVCPTWYEQRKGRITGTKAHDIFIRKDKTKPDNLVRLITGSKCYNLTHKKAVKWGNNNEEKARQVYIQTEKNSHTQLSIRNVGLLIDHRKPFLAVSTDGLISCDCCERRLLEIKCPFKHREKKIMEINDKEFCLDSDGILKKNHRYYTQIQLQLHVYNLKCCHLFIYTCKDSIIVPVTRNEVFIAELIKKCETFFFSHLLPELLTRNLENSTEDVLLQNKCEAVEEERDVWCLCQEPEYGRMIQCCNEDCPTQWFHYPCVNVRRCPRGKWLCPECLEN